MNSKYASRERNPEFLQYDEYMRVLNYFRLITEMKQKQGANFSPKDPTMTVSYSSQKLKEVATHIKISNHFSDKEFNTWLRANNEFQASLTREQQATLLALKAECYASDMQKNDICNLFDFLTECEYSDKIDKYINESQISV